MMFRDADDQPPIALPRPYVGFLDAFTGSELNQIGAGRSTGLELLRKALSYPRHTRIVVVQVLPLLHRYELRPLLIRAVVVDLGIDNLKKEVGI